jgi:hypothetical protein
MSARPIRVVYGELHLEAADPQPTASAVLMDGSDIIGHLRVYTRRDAVVALGELDHLVDRVIQLWETLAHDGLGRATVYLPDRQGSLSIPGCNDLDARCRAHLFVAGFHSHAPAAAA